MILYLKKTKLKNEAIG